MATHCAHLDEIRKVTPTGQGCVECLASGMQWTQLRLCLTCGHVGCCETSAGHHAEKHFHETGHPIIMSFEPGEDWGWCYIDSLTIPGVGQVAADLRMRPELHATRNDLAESVRAPIVELLNSRLADCIDLQTQVKQAHWNVKGAQFFALHKLFDEIYEDVTEYVDLLAERAVQLGGVAEGTARIVAQRSKLTEYPHSLVRGNDHAHALADVLADFGGHARRAIDRAAELHDADTADVFTEISRSIDKWLWMVESHLHAEA
jgi:starvation-inducible DNA-binding protein